MWGHGQALGDGSLIHHGASQPMGAWRGGVSPFAKDHGDLGWGLHICVSPCSGCHVNEIP